MELSKNILRTLCINQFDASNWKKRKKWVSPTKRVLVTKMNYENKFYNSQNCPHNKKFDRSLTKNNFSYNLMAWKILFQTNCMATVTVKINISNIDLDICLNLLSIFFTSQNYIIITLVNTMQYELVYSKPLCQIEGLWGLRMGISIHWMFITDRNLNVCKGLALLRSVAERKHFCSLPLTLKYPRSDC